MCYTYIYFTFYGSVYTRVRVYFVMSWRSIRGGELFEYIETEGRVDEHVTVRLLRQVLRGVQFLHSHNILHMDIKVSPCLV